MKKQINLVGPYNNTGYGHAVIGYLNALEYSQEYEVIFRPIGGIHDDGSEIFTGFYKENLKKTLARPINNEASTLIFWHISHINEQVGPYKDTKQILLMSTFETLLSEREKKSLVDLSHYVTQPIKYIACCKFNHSVFCNDSSVHLQTKNPIRVNNKVIEHATYFWPKFFELKKKSIHTKFYWKARIGLSLTDHRIICNIGKYEARKGTDEAIEIIENCEGKVTLIAYWYNPFQKVPMPYSKLIAANWASSVSSVDPSIKIFSKGEKNIVLMPPTPSREVVYRDMYHTHAYVCFSKAEGYNLPLREAARFGMPLIFTDHTANSDCPRSGGNRTILPLSWEIAYDGQFFLGDKGDWAVLDKNEYIKAINQVSSYDPIGYRYHTVATSFWESVLTGTNNPGELLPDSKVEYTAYGREVSKEQAMVSKLYGNWDAIAEAIAVADG